jgi:hypothetical protein
MQVERKTRAGDIGIYVSNQIAFDIILKRAVRTSILKQPLFPI